MKKKRARPASRSAARPRTLTAPQALWLELMQFYIREAWLLDERKFKEWLDLFTDDVLYFMPRRKNVPRREAHRELTPLGDLAILEEDKRYLEMRVARLDTGMAWAEDPPSRTRHLVGNLEAAPLDNGEVQARTAFLVYRSHLETDHQILSGCREDVLRRVKGGGRWRGARSCSTPTSCSTMVMMLLLLGSVGVAVIRVELSERTHGSRSHLQQDAPALHPGSFRRTGWWSKAESPYDLFRGRIVYRYDARDRS